jgi:signal transduction histidine kinase
MSELRAHYNAEQRELEIALLRRDQDLKAGEIDRRRLQNLVLGIGLALGLVLFGAVLLLHRVRMRAQRRMQATTEHAREKAETAERLKSRLLMMASHDLKVPLAALNATAELIGRSATDASIVQRLAEIMRADTARLRSLVRDFLDAAAIEEGNLQLHTVELNLSALAKAAVETLRPVASAKGQQLLYLEPARELPLIEADADRLRQVFDNLLGNAIKFTPAGGRIEMAFGEAGGWAFAEVRDNGPGLGPAEFAKIFAPPARLAPDASKQGDSSGLGLVITRELLTLQGGRLEVQSRPGSGAVFRVLLPVAQPTAAV